jgi:hypothetical protein
MCGSWSWDCRLGKSQARRWIGWDQNHHISVTLSVCVSVSYQSPFLSGLPRNKNRFLLLCWRVMSCNVNSENEDCKIIKKSSFSCLFDTLFTCLSVSLFLLCSYFNVFVQWMSIFMSVSFSVHYLSKNRISVCLFVSMFLLCILHLISELIFVYVCICASITMFILNYIKIVRL